MTEDQEPSGQYVQSLARGLSVIRAFGHERPSMTLSEIAEVTGLTRATARRFLLTLSELGYVRADGRMFALTPRVLELGFSYLSGLGLPEIITPQLESLSRQLNESASASVLDHGEIVYIARAAARRIMAVSITVGTRFPAHATSMGRVLLAGLSPDELDDYLASIERPALTEKTVVDSAALRGTLDQVREQGWALVDQELEPGLRSIAAPLRGPTGAVLAAINVSTSTSTASLERISDEYRPALLRAAASISAGLSHL
ncbi:IclR family transcriptional regulator domain-containing protein [Mycetocola zhadangensis]|uniref:Glycerol operon regulatory protein n=1 Tax=Mycetocola zhadangensis TaxID=1164595 RepID=A0A3L7ISC8_9MICO|nr:IclR family transcriptional regulator C-terminal domain-containing protein [Mycetocola zhadangensis]RLQ81134.1 IclR family transcriptional regulator [Mycetocola zhadangensis]GGF05096.1 IclR family transcriptional regulator [Mycetocola zhadangensis]